MEEPHRSWSFPLVGVLPIRHTEQVAARPTYHHEWQQPQDQETPDQAPFTLKATG
jgi:hypothetical protein